ncbi:unnamed protein product [Oppiella nova]|uniref:Cytochrome P450 n=1 Tax=Oppiella nova TaxID=334625 RepID=A0A7R9QCQ8_9ACAR|nr:unnamed protein product [Oppiella nova]CAG2163284.1 unnamed protein product [Oppiella nova]
MIASKYLRHRYTYWSRHGVPGKNYFDITQISKYTHKYDHDNTNKYGRVYGMYTISGNTIMINDPELLRDIFIKDFHAFPDHINNIHFGSSHLSKGLFFLKGDDNWKRIRNIITPAFTSGKLRAMMGHISDASDRFVNMLVKYERTGKSIDMQKYLRAFTLDVTCACAYGIELNSIDNPDHPMCVNVRKVLDPPLSVGTLLSVFFPGLARLLKCEPFPLKPFDYFRDVTEKILTERKMHNKYVDNDKTKRRTDFIQLMIDSEKSDIDLGYDSHPDESTTGQTPTTKIPVGKLTTDEIVAQSTQFFIAGFDTSSAALSNTIYYLSQNKECQQKLYEELDGCGDLSDESVMQLKYLNGVVNETLRLTPSIVRLFRTCVKDYKLGHTGITLPADTDVLISPYAIHRDPEYWPNPDAFIPERFIEPKHHPYAYVTFGGGPRL